MSEWVSKYVSLRKQVSRQGCKQANEQVNICHKNTMKKKNTKKKIIHVYLIQKYTT